MRIPVSSPLIDDDDISSVINCLKSGWISSLGEDVLNFEKAFSSYQDAKYGVSTNSGTTALHLALASLNLRAGDEIIMPTFTMIATINAAQYLKLKVKLIDANISTWTMNIETINEKITNKTKAIMGGGSAGFILLIADYGKTWYLQKKMMEYSDFVTRISFDLEGVRRTCFP